MIYIKQLNKRLLHEYIYSEEYSKLEFVPISKHRALSHIANPRAKDEDVLLLLAYEEKELVGYLGVLPDLIYVDNEFVRCGWLSCMWINHKHRGKKIAFKLVQKSIELWDKKILVTEFTDPARRLYDKTENFVSLKEIKGIRLYLRFNLAKILPPKRKFFNQIKTPLKIFDALFNGLFDLRYLVLRNKLKNLQLEYVNQVDEEIDRFVEARQQKQIFKRRKEDLNWIIKNPWILSSRTEDEDSKRYHFSSLEKRFEFVPIKIFDQKDELIAFVLFARRNDDLKIPYCYGKDKTAIIKVIRYHLIKWRIKTFTAFNTELLVSLQESRMPALFRKEIKRNYIVSSSIVDDQFLGQDFEIQDGDADCSFT